MGKWKDTEAKRAYDRESYRFWKSLGVCTRCQTQDAYTLAGRPLCGGCAEREAGYDRKRRKVHGEEINRDRRERYAARKAAGLCPKCGGEREPGFVKCKKCRAADAIRSRKYKQARRPETNTPRGDNGICYWCNKAPSIPGKRLCVDCMAKASEEARRRFHRENAAHPWRQDETVRRLAGRAAV